MNVLLKIVAAIVICILIVAFAIFVGKFLAFGDNDDGS